MEMTGEQLVPLPQQETWNALNDPAVLKDCIPGCESMELKGENEYEVVMVAKVGPVSAKFKGKMTMTESDPPRAYTLNFEGSGGAAGFAKGQASVSLTPQEGGTLLQEAIDRSVAASSNQPATGRALTGGWSTTTSAMPPSSTSVVIGM